MRRKRQPSAYDELSPLTKAEQRGIAIAAYICRMYGDGEVWAEVIESKGEQKRARYWMKRKC